MDCLNPQSRFQIDRRSCRPGRCDDQVRYRAGPQHAGHRRRNFARTSEHRHLYRLSVGGARRRSVPTAASAGSVLDPPNFLPFASTPTVTGNPNVIPVNTKSVYALETANYQDFVILTGGAALRPIQHHRQQDRLSDRSRRHPACGITMSALSSSRCRSPASTPPTARPSRSARSSTARPPTMAACSPIVADQTDLRPGRKQGRGSRHQMGIVRPASAGDRGAVPHRRQQRARIGSAAAVEAGRSRPAPPITCRASTSAPRQDHRQVEHLWRRRAHEQPSGCIGRSDQCRSAARLHRQPILQLADKYKVTDDLEVGGQATYRSKIYGGTLLAANQGTVLPDYWRFDAFVEGKVTKNWKWKVFANNIFNKLYYDAFYQSAAPFVLVAPGRVLGMQAVCEILKLF